jgi:thiamine biosynthesis lipoprotein
MGTVAAVQCADPAAAHHARDLAQAAFDGLDRELSAWTADSALAAVNAAAGTGRPVPVSPDFAAVLRAALDFCSTSDGAFNPLVGPVMRLWGFNGADPRPSPPPSSELAAALALADWRTIQLAVGSGSRQSENPHCPLPAAHCPLPTAHCPLPTAYCPLPTAYCLLLPRAGMSLDFGAIAKGYAVDLAWARLKAAGHTNLLVDFGGNLRALGEAAPGRGGWRTGVRNPFASNTLIGKFLMLDGEAVATSGNYERFVEIDGFRYAHIMDGRTGRPVTGMAGVTVIAPDAMTADGLSTALFVLGPQKGAALLRGRPGCEALWIPDTPAGLTVLATPGFAARLTPVGDTPYTLTVIPVP